MFTCYHYFNFMSLNKWKTVNIFIFWNVYDVFNEFAANLLVGVVFMLFSVLTSQTYVARAVTMVLNRRKNCQISNIRENWQGSLLASNKQVLLLSLSIFQQHSLSYQWEIQYRSNLCVMVLMPKINPCYKA